jgi:alpha-L-fucosidase
MQNESAQQPFGARDVRFTTRGDTLHALLLGWPASRTVAIESLGSASPHARGAVVERVRLLGAGPVDFARDERGLAVTLPERPPEGAVKVYALEIAGRGLVPRERS